MRHAALWAWRRPRCTALVLALLLIVSAAAGLYGYALHEWHSAQTAVKNDRFAEARDDLKVCLFLWPYSVPVHLLAARAARSAGDLQSAEAHLNQCLKLPGADKADVQLEFLLMRVQTGDEDAVAPDLLAYVDRKHPEASLILETLAGAYMDKLRYGPAFAILERWVKEAPDAAKPLYWRGWVRERMGDNEGAKADYEEALERDPDLVAARLRLAEVALDRADPPAAAPHLERLIRQYPDRADVTALLGRCRFLQGRPADARRLLEAAVKTLPDDPPLLVTLAKLDEQDDRLPEAEKWLEHALRVDPTDSEAQYTLVGVLQHQGRQEEADAALKRYEKNKEAAKEASRLLQEEAKNPSNDPNALYKIGDLFLRGGQGRVGEYWMRQALELDPGHQPTLKALVDYYETKGDQEQADALRRRLAAAKPKHDAP